MNTNSSPLKVWLIQPVITPYWVPRIESLSSHSNLDLSVFAERRSLTADTAFPPQDTSKSNIRSLDSALVRIKITFRKLGFSSGHVWTIPYKLPFRIAYERPDVVVVCNSMQTVFAFLGAIFSQTKILLMVEDTPHSASNAGRFRRSVKAFIYSLANSWTAFSDDSVVYLSGLSRQRPTYYVPWSIDPQTSSARRRGVSRGVTVTFVGQLIERKGVELLILAWSKVPPKIREKANLTIIGDGPLKGKLTKLKDLYDLQEVIFKGKLTHSEVQNELKNTNLFVFPSLEDLYGIVLLEALANGCPIITTPFAGGRELVDDTNGWVIDPREIENFASTLERAIEQRSKLSMMRAASLRKAKNFGTEDAMDRLSHAIHQCKLE